MKHEPATPPTEEPGLALLALPAVTLALVLGFGYVIYAQLALLGVITATCLLPQLPPFCCLLLTPISFPWSQNKKPVRTDSQSEERAPGWAPRRNFQGPSAQGPMGP